jgi:flagellar hook-associated protein 2
METPSAIENAAGAGLSATVLNEGRGSNPFSLTITSNQSGRRGSLTIDAGELDLGLDTLIRAQDAVLNVGAGAGANPRIIASSSNSVNDVFEGVSLEIHSASDEPVTITVAQNVDSIVESVRDFVDRYNEVQADIDDKTNFNQDTLERGTLLGDPTVNLIRSRLHRAMLQPFGGDGDPTFLVSVGLRRTANNRLELDEEKFREAYQTSPEKVERLFTQADKGVAAVLKDSLEGLTKDFGGVIAGRDGVLADQQGILNDRIDGLNRILDAKRARLEAQFVALESALAGLQGQQSALTGLIAQQARRPA